MKADILKKLLSVILVFILCFSFGIEIFAKISQEDQNKIDEYEKQQQILQDKIDAAKVEIDKLKDNIADKEVYAGQLAVQIENFQAQIDLLNDKIDVLESEKAVIQEKIDALDEEIANIESDIAENEAEVASTEAEIADIYLKLQDRLYETYVNGATSELELLFDFDGNGDFSTYLIMLEILQLRAESDENMVQSLNEDIAKIDMLIEEYERMIDEISVKRDEHQVQVDEYNIKENEVIVARSSLEDSQDELIDLQEEAYSYIKELNAESTAYEKLVASYEADIKAFENKIDSIINNASHGNGNIASKPGGFIWPLQYSDVYISSSYGYRYDPISGVYKLHGGTDTCCWSGTMGKAVRASASGTVIISTWHSAYGYYVGIDHGDGIVTVYAHNSSLNVSVGQHVNQGDIVAYAGSTGYSTGAHCHFEVRVNGTKVNPTGYASLPN
ncbi:MAG: peptidoglycan DD-metalloendopeptidase family protein [Clostridia bacterium]|nr:peptidoglycan DD-metalloendopeptidase family protein [Clostridia bacterium]